MASETQLVPLSELAAGEVASIRNKIKDALVAKIAKELNKSPVDIVVRDIRAKGDLDYTYEDWFETTGATADTYETMSTGTMADQRWVALYGVKDDAENQSCTQIKFNIGGGDRAIWHLQHLSEQDSMIGICPSGVVIPQNSPYTISRYVRSASARTHLVLKGFVVEPRGKVVSP